VNRSAELLTNVREPDQIVAKVAAPRAIQPVLPTSTESWDCMPLAARHLRTGMRITAGGAYTLLPASAGRSNFPPA